MSTRRLLLATRSPDKLREIRQILGELPGWQLVALHELGIEEDPVEAELERYDTFEENALAKARHFAGRTGLPTIADDSGICVDALDGEPGVRSKRFSGRTDLGGIHLDRANNELLLERLAGTQPHERTARYLCAAAFVETSGAEETFRGNCDGVILTEPRGSGGFGYDPLFLVPAEHATFGELPAERKNELSHRARAFRQLRDFLRASLDDSR